MTPRENRESGKSLNGAKVRTGTAPTRSNKTRPVGKGEKNPTGNISPETRVRM